MSSSVAERDTRLFHTASVLTQADFHIKLNSPFASTRFCLKWASCNLTVTYFFKTAVVSLAIFIEQTLNQHYSLSNIQLLLYAATTEISVYQTFSNQGPNHGPLNFPTSPKTISRLQQYNTKTSSPVKKYFHGWNLFFFFYIYQDLLKTFFFMYRDLLKTFPFFMFWDLLKKCIFSCVKASENMFSWVKLFFSYIETFYKLFFFINWALLKCFFFFMYWNPDWLNFYYAKNTPMTNKDSKKRPLCAVRLTLHPDYSAFNFQYWLGPSLHFRIHSDQIRLCSAMLHCGLCGCVGVLLHGPCVGCWESHLISLPKREAAMVLCY